jgi:hypothetical protein
MADPRSLDTVAPNTPSHADNGDSSRTRWADTSREDNPDTRVTSAQASIPSDFRSMSRGEELGCPIEIPDPFGMGGTVKIARTPDPWGVNRPIGGTPNPNAGRPRP